MCMCSVLFPTCIREYAPTLQTSETHYMDVACHPIISIPAPHHKVQYSEVKHHNEKPVSALNRCGKSSAATCLPHNIHVHV